MKRTVLWLLVILAIGLLGVLVISKSNRIDTVKKGMYLTPVDALQDVHGLAVDVADSSKVWLASHDGLFLLKDDRELFAVGSIRDDFMGFSPHPIESNTFFSSGHPASGGNIGFQKSSDAGRTWQKVSDGINGPVDFHTMAVDQIDPNIIYGSYKGQLQKSIDGGNSWEIVEDAPQALTLTTNTQTKNTIYASTQNGLFVSKDQGDSWTKTGLSAAVFAIAINPLNSQEIIATTQSQGLVKSIDGGATWQAVANGSPQPVLYMAYDKKSPSIIYIISQDLSLQKTQDGGKTWRKVM